MKISKKQIKGVLHTISVNGLSGSMSVSPMASFKIEGSGGIVIIINGVNVTESVVFNLVGGGTKAANEIKYTDEMTGVDFSGLVFSVDADDEAQIVANFKESDISNGITFA